MGDTARTFSGSCRLNSAATDPFTHSGNVCNGTNCLTQDAAVECSLPISNISLSGNLVFQNICSYPSAQPNSDPSDCVLAPTTRLAVNIQTGDNYKSGLSPTAITLSSFTARAENARIIVAWTTLSEFNNAGFNLYRSDRADGNFVRINDVLIPSQTGGALTGAEYAWTDNSAQPGVTYYYKLEDVDIYGTTSWHGPVSAARQPFASFPIFLPLVTAR
jgi:hypothetical protein